MNKKLRYIVVFWGVLITCNARGGFDFTNYTPTLGTDSAYTITFTQVANNTAPSTITMYSVDTNGYSITPQYWRYSINSVDATNNRHLINSNTNIINEAFIGNIYNQGSPNEGSAINNNGYTINSITGDFLENTNWSNGGAVYNNGGIINSITGDFLSNQALYSLGNHGNYDKSGAINNTNGVIGSITGNFIGNTATSYGGAIYNYNGTINSITGDFIGNATGGGGAPGGAIYNYGNIGTITGNFIDNTTTHSAGAIYNSGGTIESITGDFIGNSTRLWGGAIRNNDVIESIVGNFIGNSAERSGGAIHNDWIIGSISANFIGNHTVEAVGSAVYTSENIKFLSEFDSYIISGNYGGTKDIAITIDGENLNLTFENNQNTSYTVNDEIGGVNQNLYNMYITGDGTGWTNFNNNINDVNTVNINNGKMIFNRTPDDYTGTADTGHFNNAPTMNLQNATFDIANGYTETITLNGLNSIGNNNFIVLDLDIANNIADNINITDSVSGRINLVINALSNLDIDDNIIWFANADSEDYYLFNLYSISGLDYNLGLYFDQDNHKYGLVKSEYSNIPNITLSDETLQLADWASRTVSHTVKKLTNSMQKRVGELQWLLKDDTTESDKDDNQSNLNNAFWVRGIHKNFDTNNTTVVLSDMEFGYDRIISSTNNYKWYIGALGYISGGNSSFKNIQLDINGYGLGAYVMMLEKTGWFADLALRQHFIELELSNDKTDYTATSLNMEIGKEFIIGDNVDELQWFVKPSVEAAYIVISGADVGSFSVQDSISQTLSLSLIAGPRWGFESGRKIQVYGKVGYIMDYSKDPDVIVNGIKSYQKITSNTPEFGLGLDYRGIDNSVNVYLETSYITGTDYSEISGNIGLRYTF